jgi:hypothetical protein
MKALLLLLASCATVPAPAPAPAPAPVPAPVPPDHITTRATHGAWEVTILPGEPTYTGHVTMELAPSASPVVWLHLPAGVTILHASLPQVASTTELVAFQGATSLTIEYRAEREGEYAFPRPPAFLDEPVPSKISVTTSVHEVALAGARPERDQVAGERRTTIFSETPRPRLAIGPFDLFEDHALRIALPRGRAADGRALLALALRLRAELSTYLGASAPEMDLIVRPHERVELARRLARAWWDDDAIAPWLAAKIAGDPLPLAEPSPLDMLEGWLGPDRLRDALRAGLHGDLAAAIGDEDLAAVVHQREVPVIDVELRCDPDPTLTLERRGDANVPVCVRYASAGKEHKRCLILKERSTVVPLDDAAKCPTWVQGNDGARGAYRVAYRGDLLAHLADAGRTIPPAERARALRDAAAVLDAGDALALLVRAAGDPDVRVLDAAAAVVDAVRSELSSDEDRAALRRFVRKLWGARAAALGFRPKPGEDDETRRLRLRLLALVGDAGADPHLLADARLVVTRWLDDRRAVDPDVARVALPLAAAGADRALLDRLIAISDEDMRGEALSGLRSAELARVALSADPDPLVYEKLLRTPETRDAAIATMRDAHVDAAVLATLGVLCDAKSRAELEAMFTTRAARVDGGTEALDAALARIDACIAAQPRRAASAAGVLRRY